MSISRKFDDEKFWICERVSTILHVIAILSTQSIEILVQLIHDDIDLISCKHSKFLNTSKLNALKNVMHYYFFYCRIARIMSKKSFANKHKISKKFELITKSLSSWLIAKKSKNILTKLRVNERNVEKQNANTLKTKNWWRTKTLNDWMSKNWIIEWLNIEKLNNWILEWLNDWMIKWLNIEKRNDYLIEYDRRVEYNENCQITNDKKKMKRELYTTLTNYVFEKHEVFAFTSELRVREISKTWIRSIFVLTLSR